MRARSFSGLGSYALAEGKVQIRDGTGIALRDGMARNPNSATARTGPVSTDALAQAQAVARLLDRAIAVPGTRLRIGLDGIVGLIPGVGDAAGALASAYVIFLGYRAGAPAGVLARMAANVWLDAIVGGIPLLGDLFDFGFKANTRNVSLLERSVADPSAARRAGRGFIAVLLGVMILVALGIAALVVLLVRLLAGLF